MTRRTGSRSKRPQRHKDSPYKLTTGGTWRRRVITLIVIIVVIAGAWITASVISGSIPSPIAVVRNAIAGKDKRSDKGKRNENASNANTSNDSSSDRKETESNDTVAKADEVINSYYAALSSQDSNVLHQIGADAAASAIERDWLTRIHYAVNNIGQADATTMPTQAGTYAGEPIYQMSSFFSGGTDNTVTNDITGTTAVLGWIWFDQTTNAWHVVDPTIPTSISAPSSTTVTMKSSDGSSTVSVTSDGALSNPWYAWMQEQVNVTTSSTVTMTKQSLDSGITANIPSSLLGTRGSTSGTVTIVRGVTSDFGIDKVGQDDLQLTGDMTAVKVQTDSQDITPSMNLAKQE